MHFDLNIAMKIVETLAIIVAGLWAFWRFILQRESHAKIEFDVNLEIIGYQNNQCLVEVIASITNKGNVRHIIRDFQFSMFTLSDIDTIVLGNDDINNQVKFKKIIDSRSWFPDSYNYSFIDSGVTQNYRHITAVPKETCFILLQSKFVYPDKNSGFHSAQKTFNLKKESAQNP